jgi:hypothetical protein
MDETNVHGGDVGMDENLRVAEPLNWPGRQRREEGRPREAWRLQWQLW